MTNFAPGLAQTVNKLGIPIVYARDYDPNDPSARDYDPVYNKKKFENAQAEVAHWTGVKASAIEAQCNNCYSQYQGQTWKNVISIGDSDFERNGTRDVVKQWCSANSRTAYQLPRTKTVKLLDDPTCEDLSNQLKLLMSWLPELVRRDDPFNIDLDEVQSGSASIDDLFSESCLDSGHANSLVEGRLWKVVPNGDPMCAEDWIRRRIWLSSSGHIWYESLQGARPALYFPGVSAHALSASPASKAETTREIGG